MPFILKGGTCLLFFVKAPCETVCGYRYYCCATKLPLKKEQKFDLYLYKFNDLW